MRGMQAQTKDRFSHIAYHCKVSSEKNQMRTTKRCCVFFGTNLRSSSQQKKKNCNTATYLLSSKTSRTRKTCWELLKM